MKHAKSKFSGRRKPIKITNKCVKTKVFLHFRLSCVLNFNSNTFRRQDTRSLLCNTLACVAETRAVASALSHDLNFFIQDLIFLVWTLSEKLRYVINIYVVMGSVQPDWFIRFDDSAVLRKNSPKWFVLHKNKSGKTKQTQYQCKHNRPAWTRSTIR